MAVKKTTFSVDQMLHSLAKEMAKEKGLMMEQYIARVIIADVRSTATSITDPDLLAHRLDLVASIQHMYDGQAKRKKAVAISNLKKGHRKTRNMMAMRERRKKEREENGRD